MDKLVEILGGSYSENGYAFLTDASGNIINHPYGTYQMSTESTTNVSELRYSELVADGQSILDFSKIEDGKMEIIPVQHETLTMLDQLVQSVSVRAREKGLELIVEADPALPCSLIGDDVRLTQVILNLLTNAIKYTERGSVTFSVACGERTDSEIMLHISVKDTGVGIRPEDMDKVFETFTRIDEERNRNIKGTGLGMAIVTRLLALMDSRLSVDSVYGADRSFPLRSGKALRMLRRSGQTSNTAAARRTAVTESCRILPGQGYLSLMTTK